MQAWTAGFLVLASCGAAPSRATAPGRFSLATLTFIQSPKPDDCRWIELDATTGSRRELFAFHGACARTQLSYAINGQVGVVFLPKGDHPAQAWQVDLARGTGEPIPLSAAVADAAELALDRENRVIALVGREESTLETQDQNGEKVFVVDGEHVADQPGVDGIHGVAVAYRLDTNGWNHVETTFTTFGWDYARGVHAVSIDDRLGPTSLGLTDMRGGAGAKIRDATVSVELARIHAPKDGDTWAMLETPGPIYFYEESAEFAIQTAPLYWKVAGALAPLPDLGFTGPIHLTAHGDFILVASGDSLREYDVQGEKRIVALENVYAGSFRPY